MEMKLVGVRMKFSDLFVAQPFKPGDTPRFRSTFLVKKGSPLDKEIDKTILQVAEAKWPGKGAATIKSIRANPNKFCYQDGDNKEYDGYADHMAISANNVARPLVIDRDKSVLTAEDGKPYDGCYVIAKIDIFAYSNSGNGISASLSGVQFYKDGEAFSGGRPASLEDFDDLGDTGEDDLEDLA